ncbi:expressed unknown protein [Seminavis robusta]|uniref:Uncharacterized protein n=1 Tax=Seminavis robusta TaxID=568900 RepID=A0A9N8E7X6_9STRA|nr:expressed unknown protein [Seminavis robusta]|eukprot:Sro719_g192270.1 n/a (339) ;mRNA; f:3721-4737
MAMLVVLSSGGAANALVSTSTTSRTSNVRTLSVLGAYPGFQNHNSGQYPSHDQQYSYPVQYQQQQYQQQQYQQQQYQQQEYTFDTQAMLHIIRELDFQLTQYQEAKLHALQCLNELLQQLIALQRETITEYNQQAAREMLLQAVEYIESIEREYLNLKQSHAATAAAAVDTPMTTEEQQALYNYYHHQPQQPAQHDTAFHPMQQQQQQQEAEEESLQQKLSAKVPNRVYRYARPMKPMSNPGLPNYMGDTVYANLKAAQPILTAEFEKMVNSIASNPSALITLKKNQPVFVAEYEQLLYNLKQNQPMLTTELTQMITDVKSILVTLVDGSIIGGGGLF